MKPATKGIIGAGMILTVLALAEQAQARSTEESKTAPPPPPTPAAVPQHAKDLASLLTSLKTWQPPYNLANFSPGSVQYSNAVAVNRAAASYDFSRAYAAAGSMQGAGQIQTLSDLGQMAQNAIRSIPGMDAILSFRDNVASYIVDIETTFKTEMGWVGEILAATLKVIGGSALAAAAGVLKTSKALLPSAPAGSAAPADATVFDAMPEGTTFGGEPVPMAEGVTAGNFTPGFEYTTNYGASVTATNFADFQHAMEMAQGLYLTGMMKQQAAIDGIYNYATATYSVQATSMALLSTAIESAKGAAAQGAATAAAAVQGVGPSPNIMAPVPPTAFAKFLAQQFRDTFVIDYPGSGTGSTDVGPISIAGLARYSAMDAPPLEQADISAWGAAAKQEFRRIANAHNFAEQTPYRALEAAIGGSALWFSYLRGQADVADIEFLIGLYRQFPYNVTIPPESFTKMDALIDQYVADWPIVRVLIQQKNATTLTARADWDARAWALVHDKIGYDAGTLQSHADVSFGMPYGGITWLAMTQGQFSPAGFLAYEFDTKFNPYYQGGERQHIIDPFYAAVGAAAHAADLVPFSGADWQGIWNAWSAAYTASIGKPVGIVIQSHEGVLNPTDEWTHYYNDRLAKALAAGAAANQTDLNATFRASEAQRISDLLRNTVFPQAGYAIRGAGDPRGWTEYIDPTPPDGAPSWNDFAHSLALGAFDGFKDAYAKATAMLAFANGITGARFV